MYTWCTNTIYSFVVRSPWGWRFAAQTCTLVQENCALLCHYAASSDNFLPIFRDKFSVPFSGVKISGPIGCPETSVRNCHYSLRNNPEERSSYFLTSRRKPTLKHVGGFKFMDVYTLVYVNDLPREFMSIQWFSVQSAGVLLNRRNRLLFVMAAGGCLLPGSNSVSKCLSSLKSRLNNETSSQWQSLQFGYWNTGLSAGSFCASL